MIETILNNAAAHLQSNVAALSKSGGAAHAVPLRSENRVRNVPAVPDGNGGYLEMLPDDSESAVAFWQVLSNAPDERFAGHTVKVLPQIARVRLIVWGNKKRLSPPNLGVVLGECMRELNSATLGEDWIQSVNVSLVGLEPRNKAIFGEYNFDEVETQFVTEPYDFASALFDVQYRIILTCLPQVAAVETLC